MEGGTLSIRFLDQSGELSVRCESCGSYKMYLEMIKNVETPKKKEDLLAARCLCCRRNGLCQKPGLFNAVRESSDTIPISSFDYFSGLDPSNKENLALWYMTLTNSTRYRIENKDNAFLNEALEGFYEYKKEA